MIEVGSGESGASLSHQDIESAKAVTGELVRLVGLCGPAVTMCWSGSRCLEMIKGVADRVLPGEIDWHLGIHMIKKTENRI